jgi:hypothetical protein
MEGLVELIEEGHAALRRRSVLRTLWYGTLEAVDEVVADVIV